MSAKMRFHFDQRKQLSERTSVSLKQLFLINSIIKKSTVNYCLVLPMKDRLQTKTVMRRNLLPVGMAVRKKTRGSQCRHGGEKGAPVG